jgi:hypothetical protein
MPLLYGVQWSLTWKVDSSQDIGLSAKVDIPVTGAAGVKANADASAAFKESVDKYWEFDRLDMYMVQPWASYIADSLRDEDLDRYIKKHTMPVLHSWEVYMISSPLPGVPS